MKIGDEDMLWETRTQVGTDLKKSCFVYTHQHVHKKYDNFIFWQLTGSL